MYCKRCKTLIPDDETICPKCNYDNSKYSQPLQELNNYALPKRILSYRKIATLLISIILISIGIITLYTTFSKADIEVDNHVQYKTFTFNDLKFKIPSTYGTSTNTIFYKNNTDINININEITSTEYDNEIKKNKPTSATLNKLEALMYQDNNTNTYLLKHNDAYYIIRLNYVSDAKIYTDDVKNDINKILNSIN